MKKPKDCNEDVYKLMTTCWESDSQKRTSFLPLVKKLINMLTDDDDEFRKSFEKISFYHQNLNEVEAKLEDEPKTHFPIKSQNPVTVSEQVEETEETQIDIPNGNQNGHAICDINESNNIHNLTKDIEMQEIRDP